MTPKTIEERRLWKQGYRFVACVDEVGRGPLAGPVVACAVCFIPQLSRAKENLARLSFPRLKDSKKLSPKRREEIYNKVKEHLFESEDSSESERPALQWGIGRVSPRVIDRINIFQATKLAMQRAVSSLEKKLIQHRQYSNFCYSRKQCIIDFLILDGNIRLNVSVPQRAIVKADEKVFSCALASIIAKVTRDRIMVRYHKKYPQYGFDKHKGYGTLLHMKMLKKYGPCPLHRKTFNPVSTMTNF